MNPDGQGFLVDLAARLLHASWQGGVLALAVLAISLVAGRRLDPRFLFLLWLLVFARLAMPVVPTATWSMFGWFSHGSWQITAPASLPTETLVAPAAAVLAVPKVAEGVGSHAADDSGDLRPAATVDSAPWSIPLWAIAVSVWLLGAGAIVTRLLLSAVWLWRARRGWAAPDDPTELTMFDDCRRQLGIHGAVSLWISPDRLGPATLGCFRPAVIVPRELVESLPADELRLILLHELIHVRRRDVPIDRLACLVTAMHWPNPLAWLALLGLRHSRESACDAALLDRVGTDSARDYGRLILSTIERLAAGGYRPAAVGIFGRAAGMSLRQRIGLIAGYRRPSRPLALAAAALVVCTALVGLTDAKTPGVAERDKLLAQRVTAARQQFITILAAYLADTVTFDLLRDSSDQLLTAELAAAKTGEARLEALQRQIERTRETEAQIEALFNVGARGGEVEKYYAARVARETAEIALVREQLGLPAEVDADR